METRRIFFALWPDDKVRKAIIDTAGKATHANSKGRLMRGGNLHVTLHFIGRVSDEKLKCLNQAAQTLRFEPFELMLNRYGHFHAARIFWMGCLSVPEPLIRLHAHLGSALTICDYQPEIRAYTPHVTLLRKCKNPEVLEEFKPIYWQVNSFALVESLPTDEGVEYRVIHDYPALP